nr:MAG: replication associated protein [Arizlama virus]
MANHGHDGSRVLPQRTSRMWILTSFDPAVLSAKENMLLVTDSVIYAVWQIELCPETQREHVHMFIHFSTSCRFGKAQAAIADMSAHCEIPRNRQQSIEYCKKDESRLEGPWEFGTDTSQGSRSDLKRVVDAIAAGEPLSKIAKDDPTVFVRNCRGLTVLAELYDTPRPIVRRCIAIWGPTGIGKTRGVYDTWAFEEVHRMNYTADPHRTWADGYTGQKVIFLDEFNGQIAIDTLLTWTDRYPVRAEIKGGHVALNHEIVVICANDDPQRWYPNATQERMNALLRRIGGSFHYCQTAQEILDLLATMK